MSEYFFKKIFLVLLLLINITSPSKGMLLENEENSVSGIVARILNDHIHSGAIPHVGNDKKTIEWKSDNLLDLLEHDKCSTCETALYQYGFLASGHPIPENELPFQRPTGSVLSKWFHNEDEEVCPTTRFSLLPPYAPYIDKSKLMPGEPGYSLGFWNWQQIVTYRGRKMQRTTAHSIWEEEQKYQEKVLDKKSQENHQKEIKERQENYQKKRQEKYQAEKKNINYERATYEGNSLQFMRDMKGFGGTPCLTDLDPRTVEELEEADRCNPERKKERQEREKIKQQQFAQKQKDLLQKEKMEKEKREKELREFRSLHSGCSSSICVITGSGSGCGNPPY